MTELPKYGEIPLNSTVYKFSSEASAGKTYRGYVVNRKDPLGIGRIQVHIPELQTPKDVQKTQIYPMKYIWVYPKFSNQGIHSVPWYNQWVEVTFRNNDFNQGVYENAIVHEDEPLWEMNESMGSGIQPPNGLEESLAGEGQKIDRSKETNSDVRITNHEKRADNYSQHFVNASDRLKVLAEDLREACSDSHVVTKTPRQAHYHVYQDHPELNFIEKRTGNRKAFVMHDKLNYTLIRDKDQFSFIMHHGENNEDNYIELRTRDKNILMLDQENRTVYLKSHYGQGLIFEDDTKSYFLGTKSDWMWDVGLFTSQLAAEGKLRKYSSYYSRKTRPKSLVGSVVLTSLMNMSYRGGTGADDILRNSQLNRERGHIAINGNNGFIFMQDYIS